MSIIGLIVLGLIVGALGRLLHPGRDPMGWFLTLAVGVAAVLITGLLIHGHGILRFIVAVIVGAVLVAVVNRLMAGRGTARTA